MIYQIKVKGGLDQSWSDWLGREVKISEQVEAGVLVTTLQGDFTDQPALFGVLDRIRDLNLALISVQPVSPG